MFFSVKFRIYGLSLLLMFCCLLSESIYADALIHKKISIDLQDVSIQDAIKTLAKFSHANVVISPAVHGLVSLHLQEVSASKALDVLLTAHELSQSRVDNVWFVAPRGEWIQRQQEEIKLQSLLYESSPLKTQVFRIRYAKADDLAHLLQENGNSLLSKRGHVRVDVRTNTLCVQDTDDHLLGIQDLIKRLDIPVQQVLIEAHLASVDSDYEQELGVNFSVQSSRLTNGASSQTTADTSGYSLAVVRLAKGSLLDVQLAALEKEGHGELISSPSLFTANQQAASIESGEEIPYQEISKSGATAVAFKKAVLSLKVTPQIMPGDQVLLQLQINQDKPSQRMVLGVPAISTRQMSTNILVKSGQTVVLGGIYEMNKENGQQRIPFLGKIPGIGWLFKQQSAVENKRELLIFVTPKVII